MIGDHGRIRPRGQGLAAAGLRAACGLAGAGLGRGSTCAGERVSGLGGRVPQCCCIPGGEEGCERGGGRLSLRWGNLDGWETARRKSGEYGWDGSLRPAFRVFKPAGVSPCDPVKNSPFAFSNNHALQNGF